MKVDKSLLHASLMPFCRAEHTVNGGMQKMPF